jgi:hypothetical protein
LPAVEHAKTFHKFAMYIKVCLFLKRTAINLREEDEKPAVCKEPSRNPLVIPSFSFPEKIHVK